MNNVMIDLETFDSGPRAVVTALGACRFDETGVSDKFYVVFNDLATQQSKGRTISAATVCWWMAQSDAARSAIITPASGDSATTVAGLSDFGRWLGDTRPCIWGYGADFDCVVLGSLYEDFGITRPWSFRRNRCFRTLSDLFPTLDTPKRIGVHHNAYDDALTQAERASVILRHIKGM